MNKFTKRLALLFLSLMASSTIFFSCTEVDKTLGLGLIPDDEMRDFKIDTIYPDAYTVTMDSLYTSSPGAFMIGSYYDPMFGDVLSGSAFQVLPYIDSMSFGTNPTYESLILQLALNSSPIGDENISQTVSVYELTERIYYDSVYYACTPVKTMIGSTPIASVTYSGEDTLKIELGATFANKLLNASKEVMAYDQDTLYHSPFFDYMKGFYVVTNPVAGGSGRMNFFNPAAYLHLTYSNVDTTNATVMYNNVSYDYYGNVFYYSQFNAIKRDYSTADPAEGFPVSKLGDTTATGLHTELYLQGFFGAVPYIKISSEKLKNWLLGENLEPSQAGIIRAELIMELEEFNGFDITKYPAALGGMTLLNPLTTYSYYYGNMYVAGCLSSFYYSLGSFDGSLNKTLKKYSINITHELINQLRNNTDLEFYLAPYTSNADGGSSVSPAYNTLLYSLAPNQYGAYKAVMRGPTHANPLKLVISYAVPQ